MTKAILLQKYVIYYEKQLIITILKTIQKGN